MQDERIATEENLARARQLVTELERGDEEAARALVDAFARHRQYHLYQELGKLTRELHESLNNFRLDSRLADLAEQEIPDARERLNYVIAMTDQAATRTLNAVENSMPCCDQLESRMRELADGWQRFTKRKMDADEFRALSKELGGFFAAAGPEVAKIRADLNEVLMAQDFQDLTGQVIKRVMALVEDVEANLVNLIRIAGKPGDTYSQMGRDDKDALQGPPVPGLASADTVSGQDEVDALLSSLGF